MEKTKGINPLVTRKLVKTFSVVYPPMGLHSDISVEVYSYQDSKAIKVGIVGDHVNGYHTFVADEPKEFLRRIEKEYTLQKFVTNNELYELDEDRFISDIKRDIAQYRKEYREEITREDAREIYDEVQEIYDDFNIGEVFYQKIWELKNFDLVFPDNEFTEIYTVKNKYNLFWDKIWLPFVENYEVKDD